MVYTVMWVLLYLLFYVTTLHQLHWLHCFNRYVKESVWSTEFWMSVSRSRVYTGCFTIVCLKQTMFLGCIVLQLFCSYSSWYIYCFFSMLNLFAIPQYFPALRVHCPIWLFAAVPWFRACAVCCWVTVWVTLRWFQLPLLLLVSLLVLQSTCAGFVYFYYYHYYYYYYSCVCFLLLLCSLVLCCFCYWPLGWWQHLEKKKLNHHLATVWRTGWPP